LQTAWGQAEFSLANALTLVKLLKFCLTNIFSSDYGCNTVMMVNEQNMFLCIAYYLMTERGSYVNSKMKKKPSKTNLKFTMFICSVCSLTSFKISTKIPKIHASYLWLGQVMNKGNVRKSVGFHIGRRDKLMNGKKKQYTEILPEMK
jgi:hypothetical protein